MIVSELMNIGFSSIAPFLGKSEEEIAKMPHEYTRQLAQAETIETTVVNRKGETVTTKKTRIKMKDSQMALRDLSKYIGLFEVHNRQKSPEVDIDKLDINTLKVLHDLIQQQKNTIDVQASWHIKALLIPSLIFLFDLILSIWLIYKEQNRGIPLN